jgi:Coenzyme PQQ synthesis protein D (PqqD)
MYKLSDTVRTTHSQDGAVVLDIRQGEMFNLNPVGSRILELLKSGSTETAVIDEISRQFNADRAEVERDVQEFVTSLQEHHLIVDTKSNARK